MGNEAEDKGTALTTQDAAEMFGTGPEAGESEPAGTQETQTAAESAPEATAESQEAAVETEAQPGQEVQPAENATEGQSTVAQTPPAPKKVMFAGREFTSMDEAEKAYKEMQRYATQMHELESQRTVQQAQVQQPAAPAAKPEPKFARMKYDDFAGLVEKSPYEAITGLVEEHLIQSGLGADLIEQAQKGAVEQVMQEFGPLKQFISGLYLESELDAIAKEDSDIFPKYRDRVRELVKSPGNRFGPRDVWAYVLAKEVEPEVRKTLEEAKKAEVAKAQKAKAVSAATRGTGAKVAPAAPPKDEVNEFFGATQKPGIPGWNR